MSRITFHTEHEDADVSGSERAYMGIAVTDHTFDQLFQSEAVRRVLDLSEYGRNRTWFVGMSMGGGKITVGDRQFEPFDVILNTALETGPDPFRLAARLHGQCEIHAYVEGPNRAWLADLIEQGLETGVFRRTLTTTKPATTIPVTYQQGWDDVLTLLRAADDAPVVTSYSVTSSWPNADVVREFGDWKPPAMENDPDGDWDDWWEEYCNLFYEEPKGWQIAMDALRKKSKVAGLELEPDRLSSRFGANFAASDIIKACEELCAAGRT